MEREPDQRLGTAVEVDPAFFGARLEPARFFLVAKARACERAREQRQPVV